MQQYCLLPEHKLQKLLVLTAVGAIPTSGMRYSPRLDNCDGPDIAPWSIGSGPFEEACTMYYKSGKLVEGMGEQAKPGLFVLLSLPRLIGSVPSSLLRCGTISSVEQLLSLPAPTLDYTNKSSLPAPWAVKSWIPLSSIRSVPRQPLFLSALRTVAATGIMAYTSGAVPCKATTTAQAVLLSNILGLYRYTL